jgi:hypothetical protein
VDWDMLDPVCHGTPPFVLGYAEVIPCEWRNLCNHNWSQWYDYPQRVCRASLACLISHYCAHIESSSPITSATGINAIVRRGHIQFTNPGLSLVVPHGAGLITQRRESGAK